MKKMKNKLKILPLLLACLLFVLPLSAFAEGESAGKTLSITYAYDGAALPDVSVRLYRVADVDNANHVTLTEDIAKYSVDFDTNISEENWKAAAGTLSAYITRDNLNPYAVTTANASGVASFAGLSDGVYLAVSPNVTVGEDTYSIQPALIAVTSLDASVSFSAAPKIEKLTPVTEISVLKVWSDNNSASRPKSIVVQLLQDGKVVDTETLSADNQWQYSWGGLDSTGKYEVVEKTVPTGYKVSSELKGTKYVLTNTANTVTPSPTPTPSNSLPKTGQLWWPVALLAAAGILCVAIGLMTRKPRRHG